MSDKRKNSCCFQIDSWISQAFDDLNVAKVETIPSFIRCYHAQQAMEKLLKAAFIVVAGSYKTVSSKLIEERKQYGINVPSYIPDCAWELEEDVAFPKTHDLVCLWGMLMIHDQGGNNFRPLSVVQKTFMAKASKYATDYRYPYFSQKVGMQVGYLTNNDVSEVVQAADQLCESLYRYICNSCCRPLRPGE